MSERPLVWCVGDSMLDLEVRVDRFRRTPEDALVPVLPRATSGAPATFGAAANVAANLVAMGCRAFLFSTVGVDEAGVRIADMLQKFDIDVSLLTREGKTTCKTRYYESGRLVGRYDDDHIAANTILPPGDYVPDALVLTDYGKGTIDARSAKAWTDWASERSIPTFIDPKIGRTGIWVDPYHRTTMVANWSESHELAGEVVPLLNTNPAASKLLDEIQKRFGAVVVKRGPQGSSWKTSAGKGHTAPIHPQAVYDVQGAGDTYLAALVAARCRGLTVADACAYASAAAGIAVGRVGTAVVTEAEIAAELVVYIARPVGPVTIEDAAKLAARLKAFGFKIGLAGGCFDILHPGHLAVVDTASGNCDFLFVAVDSDQRVRMLKGEDRPTNSAADRVHTISALRGVGAAFEFDTSPDDVVLSIKPDLLVKGSDYIDKPVPEAVHLEQWGGKLLLVPSVKTPSTTERIAKYLQSPRKAIMLSQAVQ